MSGARRANLTELEQLAIDAVINLSDGHPRQDLTESQSRLILRLPELFRMAESRPFLEIERRSQAVFLQTMGQRRAPVSRGRVFSAYSSSVATVAVANVLAGRRVALLHPTFDNIHDILSRHAELVPLSEEAYFAGDLSQALVAKANCVFVTTPNNPTGTFLDEPALRQLAQGCAENRLTLCLDVSFRGFEPSAQFDHYAILEDSEVDYIVIEDTGKLWPLQELKLGFLAVSEGLHAQVEHALSDVLLTVSAFVLTLVETFSVDAANGGLEALQRLVAANRRNVAQAISQLGCVELLDPDSHISVARVRFDSPREAEWTRDRLQAYGVHVLPCRQFYWSDRGEGADQLRLALARNTSTLTEGMQRFALVRTERTCP